MRKFLTPYLPASLLLVFLAMILSACDGGGGGGGGNATLTGLAINGPSTVSQSSAATYTATASWSDGSTSSVTPSWTVNPETYASISASGVLTTSPVPADQTVVVAASYSYGEITETATRDVTISELPQDDNVLVLDGVDDKAVASTALTNTGVPTWTAEAWIFPTKAAGMYILSDDPLDVFVAYEAGAANNGLGAGYLVWNQTCAASTGVTVYRDISLNQWNHVAVMYDGTARQLTFAINGNFGTDPPLDYLGSFCTNNNYQFTVGGFFDLDDMPFQGEIDDVRVSSVVRYVSNFTPPVSFAPDASTIGLWYFNEPAGSTSFSDSSGRGNTLTGLNGAHTN